jgi:hypothetical protein
MDVREDLKECKIQAHFRLQIVACGLIKSGTSYVLTNQEEIFLCILLHLKTPTHYVSSLKKKVHRDGDLKGMKSHAFDVMMQDILPLCL